MITPAPEVAELVLVALDPELHLLHVRTGLVEGPHRVGDHLGHRPLDREDVKVGAVADPHPLERAVHGAHEGHALGKRERIARVGVGERVDAQRGVPCRASDRPLEQGRPHPGEGIGAGDVRHSPEGLLVAVQAAPGGRDPD
jgi:hypothetical protein